MAIKGAILGDILGSQYEFGRPEMLDWQNVPLCIPEKAGFTDDSVMMLAIKKALDGKLDLVDTMVEIGRKYPYCGFGGNFYRWIMTDDHRPYNSWGNGSAMRVTYVADYFTELKDVQDWAKKTAEVSHNHPEGVKGAQAIAACVFFCKEGKSKQEIKEYVEKTFDYNLNRRIADIRPTYDFDVSCQGSVPEAIIAFLEGNSFEEVIRLAISLGGDSDTIGAMAGAIAACCYEIPQSLIERCNAILTEDLREIQNEFQKLIETRNKG
jgi:ADP-ribosylglycohydrolase